VSLGHPEFIIAVDRIAVELVESAGAFTAEALRRKLPFTGYSIDEVQAVLDVIVKRQYLALSDGVYVGSPMWAGGS
jgi:hypothetical protein